MVGHIHPKGALNHSDPPRDYLDSTAEIKRCVAHLRRTQKSGERDKKSQQVGHCIIKACVLSKTDKSFEHSLYQVLAV